MEVITEGVERQDQLDFINKVGCYVIQGFYYDRPLPLKEFKERLKNAMSGTNSFSSVFNKYKNGTGFTNFLGLVGELAETAASKIGMFIATLFGVEDAVKDSKLPEGLKTIKDIFATIGIVIKWVWTNLIAPIFKTIITGIRASMDEITTAFLISSVMFLPPMSATDIFSATWRTLSECCKSPPT